MERTDHKYEVLKKPNAWQTRQQFMECWILSKMMRGNTYVLIERDEQGKPAKMYVMNPICRRRW